MNKGLTTPRPKRSGFFKVRTPTWFVIVNLMRFPTWAWFTTQKEHSRLHFTLLNCFKHRFHEIVLPVVLSFCVNTPKQVRWSANDETDPSLLGRLTWSLRGWGTRIPLFCFNLLFQLKRWRRRRTKRKEKVLGRYVYGITTWNCWGYLTLSNPLKVPTAKKVAAAARIMLTWVGVSLLLWLVIVGLFEAWLLWICERKKWTTDVEYGPQSISSIESMLHISKWCCVVSYVTSTTTTTTNTCWHSMLQRTQNHLVFCFHVTLWNKTMWNVLCCENESWEGSFQSCKSKLQQPGFWCCCKEVLRVRAFFSLNVNDAPITWIDAFLEVLNKYFEVLYFGTTLHGQCNNDWLT